jgi:tetratricopeptide (TPR) repeat protein
MGVAGFQADAVVESDAFLRTWVRDREASSGDERSDHPTIEERQALIRAELGRVQESLDFFTFGSRLLQLGRYEDSILLLGRFRDTFPGREVFSNLGLAHFQLALRALAGCDEDAVTRFRLPLMVDPETLARKLRMRNRADREKCSSHPAVALAMKEAVRHTEKATQIDPTYLPARLNLASMLLVADAPSRGLGIAEGLVKDTNLGDALVLKAVALYAYGTYAHIDLVEPALHGLETASLREPNNPLALFNRARVLQERGRIAAARPLWQRYLSQEGEGLHAEAARRILTSGQGPPTARPLKNQTMTFRRPAAPLPLGRVRAEQGTLEGFVRRPFNLGGIHGAFYHRGNIHALEIGDSIELVMEDLAGERQVPRASLPMRRIRTPRGEVDVWSGYAADIVDGYERTRIYFDASIGRDDANAPRTQ